MLRLLLFAIVGAAIFAALVSFLVYKSSYIFRMFGMKSKIGHDKDEKYADKVIDVYKKKKDTRKV